MEGSRHLYTCRGSCWCSVLLVFRAAGASGWGLDSGPRQEGGEQEEEEEEREEEAKDVGGGVEWRRKGILLIAFFRKAHHLHLLCFNSWGSKHSPVWANFCLSWDDHFPGGE